MPKMTIQEARELGLLSPEELAAVGYNPFTPRAGASWTPQLGLRPGLTSSSFFRYPSLFQRPGISSLRFGLGGLGQGLTLSPESPALGLGGISAPVGAAASRRSASRGVAGGVAGGIAGGRAGIGAEGSGNLPTMVLPDGRRLVRLPDGRTMIVGGNRPPVQADAPEGVAMLQAMGVIGQGVKGLQQLAKLLPGRPPGPAGPGAPGGGSGGAGVDPELEAFAQGGTAEPVAGPAAPDTSFSGLTPQQQAALAEFASPGIAQPGVLSVLQGPSKPGLLDTSGLEPFIGPGQTVTGDVPQVGPWTGQPEMFPGGILNEEGKPTYLGPDPGGDLSLSPALYAPGGGDAASVLLSPEVRRLYDLGLTPDDIMAMMPAPNVGRAADLAPRGLGPLPSSVFAPEPEQPTSAGDSAAGPGPLQPPAPGINWAGIAQGGLGTLLGGVNLAGGAMTGNIPTAVRGGLETTTGLVSLLRNFPEFARSLGLQPGMLNTIGAGAGAGLGLLNAARGISSGDIPTALGGGLSAIGGAAGLLKSMPELSGLLGVGSGTLDAVSAGAGGLGSLLGLAMAVKSGNPAQIASSLYSMLPAIQALASTTTGASMLSAIGLGTIGTATTAGTGILGAVAPALAAASAFALPVAAVVQAITDSIAQMERERVANAGFTNNPIKGALYSSATDNMAKVNTLLGEIDARGGAAGLSTAEIADALVSASNGLMPYYATAQGGRGAIKASDTITGAGTDWAAKPYEGGQTPAEYTKNAEQAKEGIGALVQELLNRGVTYEQIGQLPVAGDWAQQTLDAGGTPWEFLMERVSPERRAELIQEANSLYGTFAGKSGPMASATGADWRTNTPTNPIEQADALMGLSLGSSMLGPDKATKASGLMTKMYGGPVWAMLARTGIGGAQIQGLIAQHFDPWVNTRTPAFITAQTGERYTEDQIASYEAQHGPGSAAADGLTAGQIIPGTGGRKLVEADVASYEAQHGAGSFAADGFTVGQWLMPPTAQPAPAAAAATAENYWDTVRRTAAPAPGAAGSMAFDPLKFLSSLQAGERASVQAGQETLTFVPYKPEESSRFTAPDAGYEQVGEGFYARKSPSGGAEIYLPQDRAADLGKTLAGYQGSPVAGQVASLMTAPAPLPSGQEAGATPGTGPAGDIAPSPVAAGTAATTEQGTAPNPTDATAGTGTPVPGTGFKKGGVVPKTGEYTLHAGELVVPANQADEILDPAKDMEDEGRINEELQGMRKKGQLNLGGPAPLEMPKPGPSWRSPDPTMPDEAAAVGGVRMAHHEESETVQDEQTGKWVNVYGRNIKGKAGQRLPESGEYDTVEEAEEAARQRSEEEGRKGAAKVKGWYVHLKEGVPSQDLDGNDPMVRRLAFTPDEVEQALEDGEAPIMVGKGVLSLPPSALRGMLQKAQDMQFKDPLKNPAVVAMAARFKRQTMKPEGDTGPGGGDMPYPGLGERILRRNQSSPKFPGHRPDQAVPLDSMPARPPDFGEKSGDYSIMDALPKSTPRMPMIPTAPPTPAGLQVNGGRGIARAMMLAQGPQGPAADFARQDRMLEGIDRGTIAPSTLGGASREQRQNLTPQDLMNRTQRPGIVPQPGLLDRARRLVTG